MKTMISTPKAAVPRAPISQGFIANGFVFTAGFGPHDPVTNELPEGIEAQTRGALANVAATLAEVGLDLSDVVKATVHLAEPDRDFDGFNATYAEVVPVPYPVRTTVGSILKGILVEIDVVAAVRDPATQTSL